MRRSRIVQGAGLLSLLVAALVAWRLFFPPGSPPIRIATILPLSGPDAAIGVGMRNAMRLAIDDANRRGGVQGRRVELVERDDASSPPQAEFAATALAADPTVIAVMAHYDHDCSVVTQMIFGGARLPALLPATWNREVIQLRAATEFRVLPIGAALMKRVAAHAWDVLGARTFVYVRDDSNFGLSMVNGIRSALTPYFKQVVTGEEMIRLGDTDFRALVARIQDKRPAYVFFGGRSREAALLLKQLRAAGVTSAFFVAAHEPDAEFIELGGEAAEGAYSVFHGLPDEMTPEGREFQRAYAAAGFKEPPSIYGIYGFAAAQVLLSAAERSFLTRPSIAGALTNEEYPTALGTLRFNYLGSTYQKVALYQVTQRRWKPILVTDGKGQLAPVSSAGAP